MSNEGSGTGWQPLSTPDRRERTPRPSRRLKVDGTKALTPFMRLARSHALHAAGDAIVVIALAGTLFFSVDANAARSRILLYLLLTMAPFALVGPLIGPALDRMRGGRRLMIILTFVVRALLMILLIPNLDTLWLFPIAFAQLVMGKAYSVAKAAIVPTTVRGADELVERNSRLAVLSAVAGGVGAAPALGLQSLFGAGPTLVYAFIVYCVGLAAALQLPRMVVDDPEVPDDEADIRSAGVRLAASAMAILRGSVGFVFFLLVFEYSRDDELDLDGIGNAVGAAVKSALGFALLEDTGPPRWKVAIPFAFWGLGIFAGNVLAPRLRLRFSEERMILGALGAVFAAAVAGIWAGGLSGAALLALIVGSAPSAAKLAFDSLVQRDAPGANHGAAFGRFETQFQIAWVIGAVLAVLPSLPLRVGFLVVALAAGFAALTYQLGSRSVKAGQEWPPPGLRLRRRGAETSPDGDPIDARSPDDRPGPPDSPMAAPVPVAAGGGVDERGLDERGLDEMGTEAWPQAPRTEPTLWSGESVTPLDDDDPPDWAANLFDGETPAPDVFVTDPAPTPPMGTPAVSADVDVLEPFDPFDPAGDVPD